MAGQRRILFFAFIGVVLLLSFWYRPPPSIRAYAPSWTLSKATSDQEAIEHLAPEFAGQKIAPIVHIEPTSAAEAAQRTSSAAIHETSSVVQAVVGAVAGAAAILDKQYGSTSAAHVVSTSAVAEAVHTHALSAPATSDATQTHIVPGTGYTLSAPALYTSPSPAVDPYTASANADFYKYLHESKSEDEFAYLRGTHSLTVAPKETAVVDEYAYLSRSSQGDAFAYLSAAASQHALSAALSGFATSIVGAQHAGGAAAGGHQSATPTRHAASSISVELGVTSSPDPSEDEFGGGKWFFQERLTDYPLPDFDIKQLKSYGAHNYKGPGHDTYATFLSTRNASLQDPYFLATLQVAHRLLYDPAIKSQSTPFTVFVAPHIPQPQRDYIAASGALVRELELLEWHPTHSTQASPRWRDMFTKLNLWAQTDFTRILYLDTDAFPVNNIDELWDLAESQTCDPNQLEPADQLVIQDICDYTFTAVDDDGGINAGMMVFTPNTAMHARLVRESQDADKFNQDYMEQAFLSYAFSHEGPFPVQHVDRKWNAIFTTSEDDGNVNVVHEKLWAMWFTPEHFASQYFRNNWDDMLKRYKTPEWLKLRAADGPVQSSM